MRVKLKSGEIVDVKKIGDYYIDKDNNPYSEEEVEVLPSHEELLKEFNENLEKETIDALKGLAEEKERIYWRDVRKEILIELIKLKYLFHDVTKSDLVAEADMFVKLLKLKDV